MSSGINAFSCSGDHPITCVSNYSCLLLYYLTLLHLDHVVFVDVDSEVCSRSDASNIAKGITFHVQMNFKNCKPTVIFPKSKQYLGYFAGGEIIGIFQLVALKGFSTVIDL